MRESAVSCAMKRSPQQGFAAVLVRLLMIAASTACCSRLVLDGFLTLLLLLAATATTTVSYVTGAMSLNLIRSVRLLNRVFFGASRQHKAMAGLGRYGPFLSSLVLLLLRPISVRSGHQEMRNCLFGYKFLSGYLDGLEKRTMILNRTFVILTFPST